MSKKILVGIPPKAHVTLAMDEFQGLSEMGYVCRTVVYGRNNQSVGKVNKLIGVLVNAFRVVLALYRFSPALLYLNSRFEPVASTRDFISLLIIRSLYLRRVKIVIKTHGSDLEILRKKSFFYKSVIVPYLTKYTDAWLFLSREEKDEIRKINSKLADRVYLTTNIIDANRSVASLGFKAKYQLEDQKFKFLFVGRIVKEKGIFSILKSIPHLDFREKCLFVFVGDGPDLAELINLSKELNVVDMVRFPGYVPDEECDHFYANTDALVFPTFFNEGFPMALFKSVAAGLPVITTNIRAAKDHLLAPNNVLWVDGTSEHSVAAAITELYYNAALRSSMAKNNAELGKKFTKQKVCESMSEVFELV